MKPQIEKSDWLVNLPIVIRTIIIIVFNLQIFQQLNIRVVLVSTITFTVGDNFTVVADPQGNLGAFTTYVRNTQQNTDYDSIMLIT